MNIHTYIDSCNHYHNQKKLITPWNSLSYPLMVILTPSPWQPLICLFSLFLLSILPYVFCFMYFEALLSTCTLFCFIYLEDLLLSAYTLRIMFSGELSLLSLYNVSVYSWWFSLLWSLLFLILIFLVQLSFG